MRRGRRQVNRNEKASRSFPIRASKETARPPKTISRTTAGVTRAASRTSGTCPRQTGSRFPTRPRNLGKYRLACGTPCAGWPEERTSQSPPRPHQRPGYLGAGTPARTRPLAQHHCPLAGYHHVRLPGKTQSRGRLRSIHRLRPPRRVRAGGAVRGTACSADPGPVSPGLGSSWSARPASLFAAEFPAHDSGTRQTSQGISLVAVNRGGADHPGVYAVITPDPPRRTTHSHSAAPHVPASPGRVTDRASRTGARIRLSPPSTGRT